MVWCCAEAALAPPLKNERALCHGVVQRATGWSGGLQRGGESPSVFALRATTRQPSLGVWSGLPGRSSLSERRLVRISVEDSNRLFAEFADWNEIFKDVSLDRLAEIDDPANDALDSDEVVKKALGGDHD
jgi:hypothetical protein